jgi:hypothetical protein
MKNIQVIDGADNCTYDIYATNDADFEAIFPGENQDIEFADDFIARVGDAQAKIILDNLWENREDKKQIHGIHGTLFFELEFKKQYYATKNESEMVVVL